MSVDWQYQTVPAAADLPHMTGKYRAKEAESKQEKSSGTGRLFFGDSTAYPVIQSAPLHPEHNQKVYQDAEQAVPNVILGIPVPSRMVPHRNFNDPITFHLKEDRQKPVHPVE
jgi:hypothetical protein